MSEVFLHYGKHSMLGPTFVRANVSVWFSVMKRFKSHRTGYLANSSHPLKSRALEQVSVRGGWVFHLIALLLSSPPLQTVKNIFDFSTAGGLDWCCTVCVPRENLDFIVNS